MKLIKVDGTCTTGPCPTVWDTETDNVVVQGFVVTDPEALRTMEMPEHDAAVFIPRGLLMSSTEKVLNLDEFHGLFDQAKRQHFAWSYAETRILQRRQIGVGR